MNIYSYQTPPKWWAPKLSPFFFKFWTPLRKTARLKKEQVKEVKLINPENLTDAMAGNNGILITPNHSSHADPLVICRTSEIVSKPFYYMAAWQVFARSNFFRQHVLAQHGVFSVDREGTDMRAFRQAVDILQNKPNPLVIFPEGEIYHVNDRVTPFRDGPAAIALTAAKRADREIMIIPTAVKYQYIQDPTDKLIELMATLEANILWRVRRDLPLTERIYLFAQAMLALKELEYLGHTQDDSLTDRIRTLSEFILQRIEERCEIEHENASIPERVKACRRAAIKRLEDSDADNLPQIKNDLDDLLIVTQLFSYPGDYINANPTIERIAETFDKFEEDILKAPTATIRAPRKVTVAFGSPILVTPDRSNKNAIHRLTTKLETEVQNLLDKINR
ncbi:MAG: 1-acyl-sn-glycerol-3-phosphate acyltransferase [Anaerohalosphaera sp.]|nr:1-acyl-sn-glycerol-3-phosphate acyltransferase [Anaerohalosphaera sp.]